MNPAIENMLAKYRCKTADDWVKALREIMQEIALLGLWRSKFFEHAAFYGGTALRVLHGLSRYSEDLDFSLLKPDPDFRLKRFGGALCEELESFGFTVEFEARDKAPPHHIDSAFLKTGTRRQLISIGVEEGLIKELHAEARLRIKLEIDIQPPPGFETESRYLLVPVPYAVRVYTLPDLFAGKLHAVLCRAWESRIKGRDWFDLVWYAGHYPKVHLSHLEARMRQSGNYTDATALTEDGLLKRLFQRIDEVDIEQIRSEVSSYVNDPRSLELWSRDFFRAVARRIEVV